MTWPDAYQKTVLCVVRLGAITAWPRAAFGQKQPFGWIFRPFPVPRVCELKPFLSVRVRAAHRARFPSLQEAALL